MNKWSDSKQWWMDLIKSVIAFAIVAFFTFLFINKLEDSRQRENFKWQAKYGAKIEALRSFEDEARRFILFSYYAMREYTCGSTRHTSKTIEVWEVERIDTLKIKLDSVKYWFNVSSEKSLFSAIDNYIKSMQNIVNFKDHLYLTECSESNTWQVKHAQDQEWEVFHKKRYLPLRQEYNKSVGLILDEASKIL